MYISHLPKGGNVSFSPENGFCPKKVTLMTMLDYCHEPLVEEKESILFLMLEEPNKLLIEGRVYGREELVSKKWQLCMWQRWFPQFVINDVALLTRISQYVFVILYIKALVISNMAKKKCIR
jgi:hypothetical protein